MSWVSGCATCANSVPDRWGANYIGPDGEQLLLCGECWDSADGFVCDCCDRLSDETMELDDWTGKGWPRAQWPSHDWATVCTVCAAEALQGVKA